MKNEKKEGKNDLGSLVWKLERQYKAAEKHERPAKKAKFDKFWSFINLFSSRILKEYDDSQSIVESAAEKAAAGTGYAHAEIRFEADGSVVASEVSREEDRKTAILIDEVDKVDGTIDGIEVIDCRPDEQSYRESVAFMSKLMEIGSTDDIIGLEASYPNQTSDPDVQEFLGWCWTELTEEKAPL